VSRRTANRRAQRGAALLVMATALILGVAWFTVGALGRAAPTAASREIRTGEALRVGKNALLSYVAQYAARPDTAEPGQLPCPESPTLANVGEASTSCSATLVNVGRLPWKTLGIDPLSDGEGEPLWYVMRGFRNAPINFATAGLLTNNGNAVVAMIIAPGRPRNTASLPGTLAGCTKQNQLVAGRNAAPLDPANFIECGVAAGSIVNPNDADWTNDRVIAITQAEWADAIAGPVADRLQRQVAPARENFRTATSVSSWGQGFLPNASTIDATLAGSQPESNNMCGNLDMRTGMPPTATVASGLCSTSWSGTSWGVDLGVLLTFGSCAQTGTELRCNYLVILGGIASPWIDATAPRVGYAFRSFNRNAIVVEINGVPTPGIVRNYSDSVSTTNGEAAIQFELDLPLLSIANTVVVRIPNPTDALLADSRSAWFVSNGWDRHTYYGVAPAATHDPEGGVCNPGGVVTGCMNVFGMPAPANDKRLVLVLMGRAMSTTTPPQARPSYTLTNYLEDQNASVGVNYDVMTVTSAFNDRVAACPYNYYALDGTTVLVSPC
jgi:hypothetical protein